MTSIMARTLARTLARLVTRLTRILVRLTLNAVLFKNDKEPVDSFISISKGMSPICPEYN